MRCERCGAVMAQERHELLDHVDRLSIRAWRCRGCGGLLEEIRTCPPHGRGKACRITYAVRAAHIVPRSEPNHLPEPGAFKGVSNAASQELTTFFVDGFTTDGMTCPDSLRPSSRRSRRG